MKNTTTLLRTQCDALRGLPPEQFKAAVIALWDYEMDGKQPDDPIAAMAVGMAKPLIDTRTSRSEAGKRGAKNRWQNMANYSKPMANDGKPMANDSKRMPKEESRKKKDNIVSPKGDMSGKPDDAYQYAEIIDYLNAKAGTAFRSRSTESRKNIKARYDEGFTTQDFMTVIDKKAAEWKGTDMAKYLRPATLFGTKFESYLNQQAGSRAANMFNNFEPSGTDWDAVADRIMGAENV